MVQCSYLVMVVRRKAETRVILLGWLVWGVLGPPSLTMALPHNFWIEDVSVAPVAAKPRIFFW